MKMSVIAEESHNNKPNREIKWLRDQDHSKQIESQSMSYINRQLKITKKRHNINYKIWNKIALSYLSITLYEKFHCYVLQLWVSYTPNWFESFYFTLNYGGTVNSSSAFLASKESQEQGGTHKTINNQQICFNVSCINITLQNSFALLMLFIPHQFKLIQVNWYFF